MAVEPWGAAESDCQPQPQCHRAHVLPDEGL